MSYNYAAQRCHVFTEDGIRDTLKIRDAAFKHCANAGAVRMDKLLSLCSGDNWRHIACVDFLVENNDLREITAPGSCAGQHRVFVANNR